MADRAMVFVDGTNLFHRLQAAKLRLVRGGLWSLAAYACRGPEIRRVYLYTSPPYLENAGQVHDEGFDSFVRIVLGDAIATGDGNFREKGVDAMLVADLIYHVATKNIQYAALVSVDTDFTHAIKRVEDFGCRTAVVGVCATIPPRLAEASDHAIVLNQQELVKYNCCRPI